LAKVAKLPAIHALYLGLAVNLAHIPLPGIFIRYWNYATGAWVFIGMMLIGVALGKMRRLEFDKRLIRWLFTVKFLYWPAMGIGLILLDKTFLHMFEPEVHGLILIFSAVPPQANLVAYAAQLNLHPEKAASAVLLGTAFAIMYIPGIFFFARLTGLIP